MPTREQCLDDLDDIFMQIGRRFRSKLHSNPLTVGQLVALKHLDQTSPQAMGELAADLGVSYASATGIVDRLLQAGMVQRYRSDTDRRMVWVELTEQGREAVHDLQHQHRQHLQAVMAVLPDKDLEHLVELLRQVAQHHEGGV